MSASWARNALLVFGVLTGLVLAHQARGDDLEQFRRENEVRGQKIVGEVQAAIAQSRKLEGSDSARARAVLRKAQALLDDDLVLPERQRLQLLQQVRERLRAVIQAGRAREAARAAAEEAAAAKEVSRTRDRPTGERESPAKGPSSVAKDYYKSVKDRIGTVDGIKSRQQKGVLDTLRDIDQSAANMTEQRITDRFVQATAKRMKKLTAKETTLLKALNSVLSVDFDKTPFREAIDYLQEKTGQSIILDEASMREAMVESDDPVNFPKVKKVQVRTILRKILGDRGLTYIIKEGMIQVVTPQKARDSMVVRTYPVADLITPIADFGFIGNEMMALQNVQTLINLIQSTVDPAIWQQGGSIAYQPGVRALVIRAPAELHYQLGFGGK